MPRLEIQSNGPPHIVPFDGPTITIGRQAGNDIVVAEKVASRKHCVIEAKEGAFEVRDLKSHNGTWIGENRVLKAALSFGDTWWRGRRVKR
ncbi:MAG: FHA domain-containing protein [Phycisphaerae bacterium]